MHPMKVPSMSEEGTCVVHREVQGAPQVEAAALLEEVGESGVLLGEAGCDTHQGE